MSGTPEVPDDELAQLRTLLLREERARLDAIDARLDAQIVSPEQIAEQLPEAIAMRARQDKQLGIALAPTVENAISESVRRRPEEFADAIFPVLGPAIRKAIAETMAELVSSINRAMEHSFSARGIRWRVESWRSGVPYAQVVLRHALVYRVEQVFLVHASTGLLLAEASPPDLAVPDADLVSGMLTAIRDFVGDSFTQDSSAGGLRSFSVGELTVMVEPGPHALLAAVVRGQPAASFHRKLQETIEGLHAQFGSAMMEFEGDNTPFAAAQPLLADCLVTVLETDARPGAAVNWRPVALVVALVVVALAAMGIVSSMRWRRVLAALDEVPGLTVVHAERGWWSQEIRGLRDPDAPSPSVAIAAAGGDTARIVQRWEPYLSLAPAVVLARAARQLDGPATVEYSLLADTLVVSGQAPLDWFAAVAARRALPSGVSDLSVRPTLIDVPTALEPLVREITAARVYFATGSALPGASGSANLGVIARRLAELQSRADELGGRVELHLLARTDGTGNDAVNGALSGERAAAVAAALRPSARGAEFIAHPLGSTDPLAADQTAGAAADPADPAARARVNRSVTLEVRLVLTPRSRTRPE